MNKLCNFDFAIWLKDDLFMISVQEICETCQSDYGETQRAGKEIDTYDDCRCSYFYNMQLIC